MRGEDVLEFSFPARSISPFQHGIIEGKECKPGSTHVTPKYGYTLKRPLLLNWRAQVVRLSLYVLGSTWMLECVQSPEEQGHGGDSSPSPPF